jgi:hypothetical protein
MFFAQIVSSPKAICAGLVMAALGVQSTWACAPRPDYYQPTNYELVGMADAIVVATATSGTPYESDTDTDPSVGFRVDSALKGNPPKDFRTEWARVGKPLASDPVDLAQTNEEWRSGLCIRSLFALNGKYVVFLSMRDGNIGQMGGLVGARINEDYFGENSLWVRVIQAYLKVQSLKTKAEQISALEALLGEQRALPQTVETEAFANDITVAINALKRPDGTKP